MAIRTYLFTGFLESGKTTFIQDTLNDESFTEGEKTLLIACEEGIEAYNEERLHQGNCDVVYMNDISLMTKEKLEALNHQYQPTQVLIEYNGMWDTVEFINERCPECWVVVQGLTTINSDTFEMYYNNMRSLFMAHCQYSDLIIINRVDEQSKKYLMRTAIRSINSKAQIIYENKQGQVVNLTTEDLPYDLNDHYIEVSDLDFGIFCMDCMDHPDMYENKTIKIKGQFKGLDRYIDNGFVLGRKAMVCCEEDVQLLGLICISEYAQKLIPDEWLSVEGTLSCQFDQSSGYSIPLLHVDKIEGAKPLENEYVTF